eukprot:1176035-Prorocentrum_minimum.AAC.1
MAVYSPRGVRNYLGGESKSSVGEQLNKGSGLSRACLPRAALGAVDIHVALCVLQRLPGLRGGEAGALQPDDHARDEPLEGCCKGCYNRVARDVARAAVLRLTWRFSSLARLFERRRLVIAWGCGRFISVVAASLSSHIPVAVTNHRRGERIYLHRAPITEGEREYTRSGHQSQKGRIYASKESRVVESPAPGIMARRSVYDPLQTGLIAIASTSSYAVTFYHRRIRLFPERSLNVP